MTLAYLNMPMPSPEVITDRRMRYHNDVPSRPLTANERYQRFRESWPHRAVNNHPWKWLNGDKK